MSICDQKMNAPSIFVTCFDGHLMELSPSAARMGYILDSPNEILVDHGGSSARVQVLSPITKMPKPMPCVGKFKITLPSESADAAMRW